METNTSKDWAQFWRDPEISALEMRFSSYDNLIFPKHTHDSYAIGLVEKGNSVFYYRGANHPIGAGQIALIPPGEVHSCNPEDSSGWRYRMFYLDPPWLHRLAEELAGRKGVRPNFAGPVADDRTVSSQLLHLFSLLQQDGDSAEKQGALYETFSTLLCRLGKCPSPPRSLPRESAAVRLSEEYIRAHLEDTVSLDRLAELTGLSPFHLLRVFKAAKGLPPHTFQTQLRIDLAKKLLSRGDDIADVAYAAGFSDQCHFSRKFKQFTGTTPRKYKVASGSVKNLP